MQTRKAKVDIVIIVLLYLRVEFRLSYFVFFFYGETHAVQKVFMHDFCSCEEEPEN